MERALASHYCSPGLIPGVEVICGLIEFVVDSCSCSKGFSLGTLVFLCSQKPKFRYDLETVDARATLWKPLKT